MPRIVVIKGCGPTALSTYAEMAAAIDRAFAAPRNQPIPAQRILANLAEPSRRVAVQGMEPH